MEWEDIADLRDDKYLSCRGSTRITHQKSADRDIVPVRVRSGAPEIIYQGT